MKTLTVKLGKAWDAIRREGPVRGTRRIIATSTRMFARVGSGDILFVTGGIGDSARYRCHHVAESLRRQGFRVSVTLQDNPFLPRYSRKFMVFIFHRTLHTKHVAALIDGIKRRKRTIIFETDDLTFDPEVFTRTDAYAQMGELERALYEGGLGREILDDPYVEVATTTTEYLAERLRSLGKRVFVVPNRLCEKDVRETGRIVSKRAEGTKRRNGVTLGYFCGSASHDRDFATIVDPLLSILERHGDVRLSIHGPLSVDPRFERFGDRVRRTPYVGRLEHWRNLDAVDVNLAPLQIGDPFCESKSELKFFEAGILGIPTVASATRAFREAIRDGEDGYVATSAEEWERKLERLVSDPDARRRMGEASRETAIDRYTTVRIDGEYAQYLRQTVGSDEGRP